jgi:FAD:protein FMN transferase
MTPRITQLVFLLAAGTALAWFACRPGAQSTQMPSVTGFTMGTVYTVKLSDVPSGTRLETLHADVDRRLQEINGLMSTYLHDSELSRFNRHQDDGWFDVTGETATVVAAAQDVSRKTDGAFDVTEGPLVNLWSFGPDPQPGQLPSAAEIERQRERIGYPRLEVRLSPPALRKTQPDVYVDLSAIAKGYAVDAVAELLVQRGVPGFMVEVGGEVRTLGRRPDGQPWRIGIEKPVDFQRSVQQVVELTGQSLATSGDYRNFFEKDGRRYSHEIDPRTGYPVQHELASVSVVSDSCMMADAWATALLVAGPEAALQLARQHGLEVLLILRTDDGFAEQMTDGFQQFLATPSQ